MALIGYARVSTRDQDAALQHDALTGAGCVQVFSDTASRKLDTRDGLARCLDHLRADDVLVVWKLDRLGGSLAHLIATVNGLAARGVGFRSITEQIDTTTPGGKLIFHVFGALAEFERDLIVERTQAGLGAARARGRTGGRPSKLSPAQAETARQLHESGAHTAAEVAAIVGCSRATLYRALSSPPQ